MLSRIVTPFPSPNGDQCPQNKCFHRETATIVRKIECFLSEKPTNVYKMSVTTAKRQPQKMFLSTIAGFPHPLIKNLSEKRRTEKRRRENRTEKNREEQRTEKNREEQRRTENKQEKRREEKRREEKR